MVCLWVVSFHVIYNSLLLASADLRTTIAKEDMNAPGSK